MLYLFLRENRFHTCLPTFLKSFRSSSEPADIPIRARQTFSTDLRSFIASPFKKFFENVGETNKKQISLWYNARQAKKGRRRRRKSKKFYHTKQLGPQRTPLTKYPVISASFKCCCTHRKVSVSSVTHTTQDPRPEKLTWQSWPTVEAVGISRAADR